MNIHVAFDALCKEIRSVYPSLEFTILEIGAIPTAGNKSEPFHQILSEFPGSRIHAFEVDDAICAKLNAAADDGMRFHALAIGSKHEQRPFYITNHPMCSSLYQPNHELISQFNNMEESYLRESTHINTVTIDEFREAEQIEGIDFIKIDIQGAELDAFKGAVNSLTNTVAIVTEVEFIPQYTNQPLFRDVDAFLSDNGFMFHKFFTLRGRALKPVTVANNPIAPSWHFLCDTMYVRRISDWDSMEPAKLLKLAVLAYLYGSPDICFRCLQIFDSMQNSRLHQFLMESSRFYNILASLRRALRYRSAWRT
ncbi:MAG: FkbM family methyltransferase [Pseudomonadota bacterium]